MLRVESETGWRLISHVDHAHLAGAFAEQWGNAIFRVPEPRTHVMTAVWRHDDGWRARDAAPVRTRDGLPSAFSKELVGKYSAFEEIDLQDYLAVRESAVRLLAKQDPYAAILVAMHTLNLLTERADRSTIRHEQLPLLDRFLKEQREYRQQLISALACSATVTAPELDEATLRDNFRLLQACDNLSLLACVDYRDEASLLHALPCHDGTYRPVAVYPIASREFRLEPYPFAASPLRCEVSVRSIEGREFASAEDLANKFTCASTELLTITVTD